MVVVADPLFNRFRREVAEKRVVSISKKEGRKEEEKERMKERKSGFLERFIFGIF